AGALAQSKPADAVKAYDEISADASLGIIWQDLAAVRAGLLLVDTAPLADMRRRLAPVAEPTRSFRHTARELLALSAWKSHDVVAARKYIDMITGDAESPIGVRARADVLSALITADGKSLTNTCQLSNTIACNACAGHTRACRLRGFRSGQARRVWPQRKEESARRPQGVVSRGRAWRNAGNPTRICERQSPSAGNSASFAGSRA